MSTLSLDPRIYNSVAISVLESSEKCHKIEPID